MEYGEWLEENSRPKSWRFVCSKCGGIAYEPQPCNICKRREKVCHYKYCPNCGVKMMVKEKVHTFEEFVANYEDAVKRGIIHTGEPLDKFDLAVQYAVGRIGDRNGYPFVATNEQIYDEIMKFAPQLMETGAKENER